MIDAIANELAEGVATLRETAAALREHSVPHALIHGSTQAKLHIPSLLDWIGKSHNDVKTQIRAYLAGSLSQAELSKQRNDARKLSEAKKPWPKKAAKKKAT